MILLCGIPTEGPIARVRDELAALHAPVIMFNQRQFDEMDLAFTVESTGVRGQLRIADHKYRLEDITAVYTRLMDDQLLPELADQHADSPARRHCRSLTENLTRWYEIAPVRLVNPSASMASNASKPYQSQIIRHHGFHIPDTLITSDPRDAIEFLTQHRRVIYKSISGIRSIVQLLEHPPRRLNAIRWCPVQFQEYVPGTNIRVHTVGAEVFATEITTDSTDYRYPDQDKDDPQLRAITLPEDIAAQCVALSRALALPVAGIDLKRTTDGRTYCFEVNPSPAFTYFENHTGQRIGRAIAQYLMA
jgi:glutathione synthase/RimK-type ligase-like ATP-grasp enzyme